MHAADHRHHASRLPLADGPSEAMLSSDPGTRTAVVFVHGFGGHATSTWAQFQRLVDEFSLDVPWWRKADLYFYGYPSVKSSVRENAEDLTRFLHAVYPAPDPKFFATELTTEERGAVFGTDEPLRVRDGPYRYDELVLVGHSEGGVVLRVALSGIVKKHADRVESGAVLGQTDMAALLRQSQEEQWTGEQWAAEMARRLAGGQDGGGPPIARGALRLFAPAIGGARITGLLGYVYQTHIGAAARPFLGSSKAFQDLQPGSRLLAMAQEDTERYCKAFPEFQALSAHILWGKADDVVSDLAYRCDKEERIADATHTSVCKPKPSYLRPLHFVQKGLA